MRPFTQAVFEREGKVIVGSRWTLDQVRQAYEKVDDLVDYISEYKAFKPVQEMGLDKIHPGFQAGLEKRVSKNLSNEAVQSLSLNVFWNLLERGRYVLRSAARAYKNSPDMFKSKYASSKQALFKDRFSLKKVPVFSFFPFKTGDNPALISDEKLSQVCADLYRSIQDPYSGDKMPINYAAWLNTPAGDKFSRETSWLQSVARVVHDKKLGKAETVAFARAAQKQNTL